MCAPRKPTPVNRLRWKFCYTWIGVAKRMPRAVCRAMFLMHLYYNWQLSGVFGDELARVYRLVLPRSAME